MIVYPKLSKHRIRNNDFSSSNNEENIRDNNNVCLQENYQSILTNLKMNNDNKNVAL